MNPDKDSSRIDKLSDITVLFKTELESFRDINIYEDEDRQFERRSYIRTTFAFIEGTTYMMKQLALDWNPQLFSRAEIAVLEEESYVLNQQGKADTKPLKVNTSSNIIFAFNSFARAVEIEYKFDTSSHFWQRLNDALKIRHRLTHPKSVESLVVTNEEMMIVAEGIRFYYKSIVDIIGLIMLQEEE